MMKKRRARLGHVSPNMNIVVGGHQPGAGVG